MGIVVLVIVVVVIAGIVTAVLGWDRYRGSRGGRAGVLSSAGAQPTEEVFLDPASGQRMRVWYDNQTGEREYRPE